MLGPQAKERWIGAAVAARIELDLANTGHCKRISSLLKAGGSDTLGTLADVGSNGCEGPMMDSTKVAQMVEVLNGLRARDALCFLVGAYLRF